MASIKPYETAKGTRYTVRYRKPNHHLARKSGFRRKKDAQDWARRTETSLVDHEYIDPKAGQVLIGDLGQKWLDDHNPVWKPSYKHSMQVAWNVHVEPQWAGETIGSVLHSDVQAWVSSMAKAGSSASVVLRAFGILKGIMTTAKDDGLIRSAGAVERIDLPVKPSRKEDRHYLMPSQLVSLADVCGSHRLLVLVLGFCGLRWGEAAALRRMDVDLDDRRVHVRRSTVKVGREFVTGRPKNWEIRDVPVPQSLVPLLARRSLEFKAEDLVFTDPGGGVIEQQSVGRG